MGHINATIEGLTTIRAFKAEKYVINKFDEYQDRYSEAIFTSQLCSTGFNFFVCMINSLASTVVVLRFLFFEHGTYFNYILYINSDNS